MGSPSPLSAGVVETSPPLSQTDYFGCPVAGIARGKCLLCALTQESVQMKTLRHVELPRVSQIVVQLIYHPRTTLIRRGLIICDRTPLFGR